MIHTSLWRSTSAALALAAASLALPSQAQNTNPSGPGPASSTAQKAGEAYPNDPTVADKNKPMARPLQRAADSRPVAATKRVTKRAGKAVKRAGTRTASAVRNTGNRINDRIPPGPNDPKR